MRTLISKRKTIFGLIVSVVMLLTLLIQASATEYFQYYAISSGTNYGWSYSRYNMLKTTYQNPSVNVTHTNGSTNSFNYVVVNSNNQSRTNERNYVGMGSFTFSSNTTSLNYLYWLGAQRNAGGFWGSATTSGDWDLK